MALNLPSLDAAIHGTRPNAKPPKREKKARTRIKVKAKPKAERDHVAEIRQYVIGRERGRCRCCRFRAGRSMHELRPRSLGGRVSKRNSVWVCGDGVTGCHGHLQRHEITYTGSRPDGAEGSLYFMGMDPRARDWMRLGERHGIESPPMRETEMD